MPSAELALFFGRRGRARLAVDRVLEAAADAGGALDAARLHGAGEPFVTLANIPNRAVSHRAAQFAFSIAQVKRFPQVGEFHAVRHVHWPSRAASQSVGSLVASVPQ